VVKPCLGLNRFLPRGGSRRSRGAEKWGGGEKPYPEERDGWETHNSQKIEESAGENLSRLRPAVKVRGEKGTPYLAGGWEKGWGGGGGFGGGWGGGGGLGGEGGGVGGGGGGGVGGGGGGLGGGGGGGGGGGWGGLREW